MRMCFAHVARFILLYFTFRLILLLAFRAIIHAMKSSVIQTVCLTSELRIHICCVTVSTCYYPIEFRFHIL
jgi:hypothetical protein